MQMKNFHCSKNQIHLDSGAGPWDEYKNTEVQ